MIKSIQKAAAFSKRKLLVEIRKLEAVIRNDPFDGLAAELQDVLLLGWNEAQKEAINEVIRKLLPSPGSQLDLFTEADLNELIPQLRLVLGDKFANDVAADIHKIILDTYAAGLTGAVALKPSFNIIDTQAINFLQQHNVYWVKHFFDNQLQEKVTEFGTKIIKEGLNRADAGKLFENEFAKKYEAYSWRYWQGFANHAVTRSREFGNTERYVRAGIEYLQVKAIVDRRTTEICRHMHNRVIQVSKAVELRDQLIAAETPEEVKEIAPWMKPDKMAAKPSKGLPTGMSLPPYHFNCRSRTIKASSSAIEEQKLYEKNVKQLHKNKDYKQHYDEYRKLGDEAPVHRSLRFDENVSIWAYTKEMHFGVNYKLYNGLKLNPAEKAYSSVLDGGLSKIRRTKGMYFRGADLRPAQIKAFTSAQKVKWPGFASTSASNPFVGNTEFVIDGMGIKVSDLSNSPDEDEFLFRPGTIFDVVKSEKVNEKWYIHLKQTGFEEMPKKAAPKSFSTAIKNREAIRQEFESLDGKERDEAVEQVNAFKKKITANGEALLPVIIE
ncbi:MAG: ADP-ribosyltransferase domain-containing protein [Balneola sp.]